MLTQLGGSIWTIAFFILALGIIVFVHEYGHYIVGRWCGIHAEVFSLGFGPVIFSRHDRHGTRWQLAAVPLGGFVKFLGDANAASGKDMQRLEVLSEAEMRHTMHGAPLWARAATVAAGPVFNFILTLAVYIGMIGYMGVATDTPVVGSLAQVPGHAQGLQVGDEVLAVNGTATPDWEAYFAVAGKIGPADVVTYSVTRAGVATEVQGPHPMPPLVGMVQLKSAAYAAGIQEGDVVLEANGTPVTAFTELPPIVEGLAGAAVPLKIWRKGEVLEMTITPNRRDIPKAEGGFETRWLIGLSGGLLFEPQLRQTGVWETVTMAANQSWFAAKSSLSGLWHVVTGQISTCNISGPIGMAQVMGQAAEMGAQYFLTMLAVMSLGIGLLNLFPIPVLDGGHLVFHIYEAVFRRPPNDRVLGVMMMLGLGLVLSFMIFALGNDLTCK